MRADETVAAIKAVGDEIFATHFTFLLIRVRYASDAQIKRENGVNAARKRDLNRPSYLPGVRTSGHNGPKSADIVVTRTELLLNRANIFLRAPFRLIGVPLAIGLLVVWQVRFLAGVGDPWIEWRLGLDKNVPTIASNGKHEVPDLALQAHVGDEAVHVLRVNARGVGGIGVAVRVAVFAVVEINEVVTMVHICQLVEC